MIAFLKRHVRQAKASFRHATFLKMLPKIQRQARIAFRCMPAEARQEMVEEAVANAFVAYVRLVERGKEHLARPSPLARYAVAQVRSGRRVGGRLRIRDVLNSYAQQRKNIRVDRLDNFDSEENGWREIVLEDRRAGPAEIAACRIDFACWLRLLPVRQRKIAMSLATGATTTEAARQFKVTPARISQMRLWFRQTWEAFQGESSTPVALAAAA